jgi:6-phosphogluconolactonase (cycloisomerase 2 family)
MKFNKSSQLLLVSAASLLAASAVTACGTLTTDFVFVTSSKAAGPNLYGEIDVFEINRESGFMRQIPTSPFPSGGRDPVAEAVSTDQTNLYVVNEDDNTIVQFVIGNDGKVYPQNTSNTPGIYPMAETVNGTNLFVVDTYQPLPVCSTASPCSGSIGVFPITVGTGANPSDPLGPPATNGDVAYWPLCKTGYTAPPSNNAANFTWACANTETDVIAPTAISTMDAGSGTSTNTYAFVTAYDSTASPNVGYIFGFWVVPQGSSSSSPATVPVGVLCAQESTANSTTSDAPGTLCPLNGGAPFVAGTHPSAVTADASGSYLYVTDMARNDVMSFTLTSGALNQVAGSPFPAGSQPSAIASDDQFVYVTNSLDSTVQAYSTSGGALTSLGAYSTGIEPVAIGIDPSTNHFLYTANYLGNGSGGGNISGFEIDPSAGTLINSQNSPYGSNAQPTAVAAISHNKSTSSSSK